MQRKLIVNGIVQGVGFRPFCYRTASELGLKGEVKNTEKGVEIELSGQEARIEEFIKRLKGNNPPLAQISTLEVKEGNKKYEKFKIVKSTSKGKSSTIAPPDVAICKDCLNEMFSKGNKRYRYWATSCTNCGPRFTVIKDLPYDRKTTTMNEFPLCESCQEEYTSPSNRRYNAQTTACPECGPSLSLLNKKGEELQNPIETAIEKLKQGKIVAIKGIGGIHLASLTSKDEVVKRLRKKKHRDNKPFAIMAGNLETIKTFAKVNEKEERLLKSYQRPIVLLGKGEDYWLSDLIAPGLHNIGVMLPYSGFHYLLFEEIGEPLIMTSANLSGEPTSTSFKPELKELADYFLLHNREIWQRADDSVIRVVNSRKAFLRRSRGYVPQPIEVDSEKTGLALGGRSGNTFTILKEGKAYVSQYIGNCSYYKTLKDLKESLRKWEKLLDIESYGYIACDLHPEFNTTYLAKELSRKHGAELKKVQHHYAHLAACMLENDLKETVGIVCDGFGLGTDKKAWGGEVILAKNGEFRRKGHLEEQDLIGSDKAAEEPLRIVYAILKKLGEEDMLKGRVKNKRLKLWDKLLEKDKTIKTTSCGRFLDAISAFLGICEERTYRGEPAMKLESEALKAEEGFEIPIKIKEEEEEYILNTSSLFKEILKYNNKQKIALSVHKRLARGLAEIAEKIADEHDIENICFTGGVANNHIFNRVLEKELGDRLRVQEKFPRGDGCLSFGQVSYINIVQ